jgi:hypothetical protein
MKSFRGALPPVLAMVMAALSLFLFTRHNDFAFFYHSDESAKVEQVMERRYNFHHPMLMLTSAQLLVPSGADHQRTVEAGRAASAIFAAVAVGAFALLAWMRAGWLAAVAVGLLLAFHQQMLELAHYMKEDPALLVGVALTFLALARYQRRPAWQAALACGLACGVAASGKYLGAVMLVPAAILLLTAPGLTPKGRALHAALILCGASAFFALANLPLLADLTTFRASLDREMDMVAHGSKGMTRPVPHTVYLSIFRENTTPAIWLLLAVYYTRLWQRRRERDVFEWIVALFPLLLTAAFSFSPKTNDRYYLPATATFYYLAALGLVELVKSVPPRRAALAGGLALALALGLEAPRFLEVFRAFQHDDRRELAEFIAAHLPADARIAQDERVMLPDARNRRRSRVVADLPQRIVSGPERYAAELGDLEKLRADGFTHVAVSESSYGRFFLKNLVAKDDYRSEHARHRAFYERLFREGELLFERPRGTVVYLHPGLRLYRLPAAASG